MRDPSIATAQQEVESDPQLRLALLKGLFAVGLKSSASEANQQFLQRRRRLQSTMPDVARRTSLNPNGCSVETDDDGNFLWQQDHDNNASSPNVCAGDDPLSTADSQYAPFAYDAMMELLQIVTIDRVGDSVGAAASERRSRRS